LTILGISNNKIKSIESYSFSNQLKLTKLNLESNSIEIMKENTFYNLNQLKELNLNNNTIKTIENNAFNGLFNLENFNISGNPLNYVDNGSFNSLFKIESFYFQNNNLSYLAAKLLKEMTNLHYLYLDENRIKEINKDIFDGLNNLKNLSISYNQLKSIRNDTFVYLKKLNNLTLNNNQIEQIDLNGFNGLSNLTYLNLNNNKLKTLQINNQSIFSFLFNLIELQLEKNQLSSIKRNDLKFLNKMEILNIKSNLTQLIEPYSFDSFPNIKRLLISIPNISNENIYSIKNSLKAKQINFKRRYYSVTYVENRVNIDCVKTLYFMKFKILYNFLYEHIDVNDFLSNCMNLYELRNNLNYLENSSNHSNEEIFPFYLKDHINPSYTPVIVLYILMTLFTFVCIFNTVKPCLLSHGVKTESQKICDLKIF